MSLQQMQQAIDGGSRMVDFFAPVQTAPSAYDHLGRPHRRQRGGLR